MSELDVSLTRGTLDLLILKALSWGARHGYAVAEWIADATGDSVLLEEGTLYPALHRLERRGWVTSEWGISDNNRKARFYTLTREGRASLTSGTSSWQRFVASASRALTATSPRTAS